MCRLLEDGHQVTALARGLKSSSARERVEEVLRDIGTTNVENLDVLEGDISQPGLGLNKSATGRVVSSTDEVWHCAA